jgi:hypothetical protein
MPTSHFPNVSIQLWTQLVGICESQFDIECLGVSIQLWTQLVGTRKF